jgi:hypothetical protein
MSRDDRTADDAFEKGQQALRKRARDVQGVRNARAPDNAVHELHNDAKAISARRDHEKEVRRSTRTRIVVNPEASTADLLNQIHDPAKRHMMHMEIAIAERQEEVQEDKLAIDLIRRRSSTRLCPAETRDGPCNKLLVGKQIVCNTHWGSATRVSNKLLPSERDKIIADRKRARTGTNQELLLDTLLKEAVKLPKVADNANASSAAAAAVAAATAAAEAAIPTAPPAATVFGLPVASAAPTPAAAFAVPATPSPVVPSAAGAAPMSTPAAGKSAADATADAFDENMRKAELGADEGVDSE